MISGPEIHPASHTIHIASVAYNTIFLGEFMQPDWDMFHSLHPMAEYHGAARAVGGCAIYVSDKPGNHDFVLLRKLVLPDGSILRAKLPGRPTKDCLFSDPARDGKTLLKIWNMNDYTGIIGVFNCQGAGWCKAGKTNFIHDERPGTITGLVRSIDVDCISKVASDGWEGDTIIYAHVGGDITYLPHMHLKGKASKRIWRGGVEGMEAESLSKMYAAWKWHRPTSAKIIILNLNRSSLTLSLSMRVHFMLCMAGCDHGLHVYRLITKIYKVEDQRISKKRK